MGWFGDFWDSFVGFLSDVFEAIGELVTYLWKEILAPIL